MTESKFKSDPSGQTLNQFIAQVSIVLVAGSWQNSHMLWSFLIVEESQDIKWRIVALKRKGRWDHSLKPITEKKNRTWERELVLKFKLEASQSFLHIVPPGSYLDAADSFLSDVKHKSQRP